jgi:ATP-dependent exoDNAse (exonuclease V) beta subunit
MIPNFEHMAALDEATHTYTALSDPSIRLTSATQVVDRFSRPFKEDEEAAKYAIKHRIKKADVLKQWAEKRDTASALGTYVHLCAERVGRKLRSNGFHTYRSASGTREAGYTDGVLGFYDDHPEAGLAGPVPELRVVHPTYRIAGTIDLITSLAGEPALLDWKTSATIDMFGFGGKKMYAPFNNLADCNFWHYAFQLNLYRVIMKEVYNYEVNKLAIIWLPGDGSYELKDVLTFEELTIKAMKKHLREVKKCQSKEIATEQ